MAHDYLAGGLDKFLFFLIVGYNEDNHDVIRTMLTSPETGIGAVGWRRTAPRSATRRCRHGCRRTGPPARGPGLPLELIVKRQTSETADFFGFADRGPPGGGFEGRRERDRLREPEVARAGDLLADLLAGGRRLVRGWMSTSPRSPSRHAGVRTRAHTGATPGRLAGPVRA